MPSPLPQRVRDSKVTKLVTAPPATRKRGLDEYILENVEDMTKENMTKENKDTVLDASSMVMEPKQKKHTSDKQNPPIKSLPVVESVNAFPVDKFIDYYVPQHIRDFTISIPRPTTTPTDKGQYDTYSLQIDSSSSIPRADLESCFLLVKLTSSEMYKHSTTGWSPAQKKKEMKLRDMRYMLLVRTSSTAEPEPKKGTEKRARIASGGRDIGGFLSFMVTYEDGIEVIYCYEIHLAPELQHRGLGKILLGYLEEIGRTIRLRKAMLTVFRANESAMRFYERMGYREDEFSPKPMKLRNGNIREYDYMILSKELGSKQTTKSDANNTLDVVW
ncbi:hypothetical protein AJ79_02872 [Helicocarpus griseus UAMH5409]|uniref:N-alpha-acetyltransferase 40 n=1 Tax=Helicocarpus griseus UAMH5409 TaxID=1447875 RepID=A0A2B7XZR1_9EURO|nr:hypothetical protein AJ79_02872 [Helicocarpus griseus UAMH5409]